MFFLEPHQMLETISTATFNLWFNMTNQEKIDTDITWQVRVMNILENTTLYREKWGFQLKDNIPRDFQGNIILYRYVIIMVWSKDVGQYV